MHYPAGIKGKPMRKLPEIVAPGGNLEKAQIALDYGADAVYLAGKAFGLRKSAENFTKTELKLIISKARDMGRNIYVTLNGFAHNEDIDALPQFLDMLNQVSPMACIVSDFGVAKCVKDYSDIPIHTSTQASVSNAYTAQLWKDLGAKRVVTARELSIEECVKIKQDIGIEIETFIHGAMCASYSGKCTISNYTSGRDSNRGGCVQSCRHPFRMTDHNPADEPETGVTSHIMNAKDLGAIHQVKRCKELGIDALKIEGRMKSNLYVANAVNTYRELLDGTMEEAKATTQINQVSNREFNDGFLEKHDGETAISFDWNGYRKGVQFIGTVKASVGNEYLLQIKAPCSVQTQFLALSPGQALTPIQLSTAKDLVNTEISEFSPNSCALIQTDRPLAKHSIIVRAIE